MAVSGGSSVVSTIMNLFRCLLFVAISPVNKNYSFHYICVELNVNIMMPVNFSGLFDYNGYMLGHMSLLFKGLQANVKRPRICFRCSKEGKRVPFKQTDTKKVLRRKTTVLLTKGPLI